MKIMLVAGARPNFMKIAPILREMDQYRDIDALLVHTGQHYDKNMSDSFFKDLGIKEPDYSLECGGGSHAEQTAKIMITFEKLCVKEKPDIVLVVGDVNSTIAAGLVAKKLQIKLIHVEAGLRSKDRGMPEEINRLATDAITDIFFTTEKNGTENLIREGHAEDKIHFVGHVMIDNLFYQLSRLNGRKLSDQVVALKKSLPVNYFCLTLHRPSNVDNKETIEKLLTALNEISMKTPIIFPCHPRTKKMIENFGLLHLLTEFKNNVNIKQGIILLEPLGYNDFLYIWKDCQGMLTDSGGLQEETTALQIPCLTIRKNTERPVTVQEGSNVLVGTDVDLLKAEVEKILRGERKKGRIPEFWEGDASKRIVKTILSACH